MTTQSCTSFSSNKFKTTSLKNWFLTFFIIQWIYSTLLHHFTRGWCVVGLNDRCFIETPENDRQTFCGHPKMAANKSIFDIERDCPYASWVLVQLKENSPASHVAIEINGTRYACLELSDIVQPGDFVAVPVGREDFTVLFLARHHASAWCDPIPVISYYGPACNMPATPKGIKYL